MAYLLARNIRYEDYLIDRPLGSRERLARVLPGLGSLWQGRQTRDLITKISHKTLAEMNATTRSRIDGFFSPAKLVEAERAWMEMQGELRTLSSRSKWIVVKGSEHWIQIHRPEFVAAAVQEIVNDARGTTPFQADPATEYK